jgi:G3E family GTPase
MSDTALPVHVVTGFLGAGKTTFINRLLKDPALADALIVVNEFGDIGLDHWLYEKIADDVVLIASGCLCCSLRGDLVDALNGLLIRRDGRALPPFSRILIETSGLADPAPILHALIADAYLARRLRLKGVTTLIDAVNGAATLDAHPEARRQLALADLVVVSKRDLVADAEPLIAKLGAFNPAARILADASASDFLAEPFAAGPVEARASAMSAHGAAARSFSFAHDAPISDSSLALFFVRLHTLLGPCLLRVKGVVAMASAPDRPLVIQGAQHLLHPPQWLAAWPTDDRRSRLVVIVDGIAPAEIESLWGALIGQPEIDRPDLAALVDNPLAPRSGGLLA